MTLAAGYHGPSHSAIEVHEDGTAELVYGIQDDEGDFVTMRVGLKIDPPPAAPAAPASPEVLP